MSDAWDNMIQGFEDAFASVGSTLGEWIPRLIVALLVLLVGRWILSTLRGWIERLLELQAVQTVFDKAGITAGLAPSDKKASTLLATVAYAFLALMLWLIVFRVLQIEPIEDLFAEVPAKLRFPPLERLIAVIPLILVAGALVIIAAAVASFVADLVAPYAERRNVAWLTTVTKVIIILAGVLAALDLLDIRFAEDLVKIVTAAAGIAFAVAFGIGGIDTAKQWWGRLAPRND